MYRLTNRVRKWAAIAGMAAVLFLAALFLATPNFAEPATSQPTPQVMALFENLSNDDVMQRQAAQKQLEAMGASIEPQLRQLLTGDVTLEAKARLNDILRKLVYNRQFGATQISLHYTNAPLADVLADLSRQAGAELGIHEPQFVQSITGRRISLDLDRVSFWKAIDSLTPAGLSLNFFSNGSPMQLEIRNPFGFQQRLSDRAIACGAFLIVPQQARANRTIDYRMGDAVRSEVSVGIQVMAEPKLKVVGNPTMNWLRECVDEKGNSLMPPEGDGGGSMNTSSWAWTMETQLRPPPDGGTKIARLAGQLDFVVQVESEIVDVPDLAQFSPITRNLDLGNLTLSIDPVDSHNPLCRVHVLAKDINSPEQGLSSPILGAVGSLQILDLNNLPLRRLSTSTNMRDADMELILEFGPERGESPTGPPKKLHWEVPTKTREISVPFELHDLPLP